jgi:hypothetical protein
MARKRSIKPGFNDDDDICALSFAARLLYIGLWGHMDKQSLIEDSPLSIRSKVFPREEIPTADIEKWRDELLRRGPSGRPRLVRIEHRGKVLLYCPTLKKHQRVYADEAVLFDVPEAELARVTQAAYEDPAGKPPGPDADAAPDPRGSRAEPPADPPTSGASASSSASASVSTSASAPAPVSQGVSPISPGLRVVDNSGSSRDNSKAPPGRGPGSRTAESCALCGGTGKFSGLEKSSRTEVGFRCSCPKGALIPGPLSRWGPAYEQFYQLKGGAA